jgi:hypothetical protein
MHAWPQKVGISVADKLLANQIAAFSPLVQIQEVVSPICICGVKAE